MDIKSETATLLGRLGVAKEAFSGGDMPVRSPVTGELIGAVTKVTPEQTAKVIERADQAFKSWRLAPSPRRGELVRLLGEELRAAKADLGRLVSIEAGKIPSEGLGEVQEMIDICDFAVGLSRQLYGLTIATERPGHRMMETWHPLGVVGIISAFKFPVASRMFWPAVCRALCIRSPLVVPAATIPALSRQAYHQSWRPWSPIGWSGK